MKIMLSSDEMLAQWKLRRGFAPLRTDCEITRSDGIDLDALLRLEMRDWYLNLLDTAPMELLAPENIAGDIALMPQADNSATVILPENCRRLVGFKLKEWKRSAKIITDPYSHEAQMQSNPYCRGGCENPIVVLHGNRLYVYSLSPLTSHVIDFATAIMEPTDGGYLMDEAALKTISNI